MQLKAVTNWNAFGGLDIKEVVAGQARFVDCTDANIARQAY